jgi:hypothetical protein
MFIRINTHTYMRIYVYIIFLKKKNVRKKPSKNTQNVVSMLKETLPKKQAVGNTTERPGPQKRSEKQPFPHANPPSGPTNHRHMGLKPTPIQVDTARGPPAGSREPVVVQLGNGKRHHHHLLKSLASGERGLTPVPSPRSQSNRFLPRLLPTPLFNSASASRESPRIPPGPTKMLGELISKILL